MSRNVEKAIDRESRNSFRRGSDPSDDEFKDSNLASRSKIVKRCEQLLILYAQMHRVLFVVQGLLMNVSFEFSTVAVVIRCRIQLDLASKFFQKRFSTN